jgi:NAD(P)-dependent dehydrogenase (short-subunit alcohol dehydrogenase family)
LLLDKVAVVTGGSSGIGRQVAVRFAQEGAVVVVADMRAEPREGGPPTDQLIGSNGGRGVFVSCDVTSPTEVESVFSQADELGGVDILFNGAGISLNRSFLEITEADFDRLMSINLKAALFVAQAAAKRMLSKGSGSIINVSSINGIQGTLGRGSLYSASKGAVRLLSYSMAAELGPQGIRVNALHPGVVKTSMTTIDAPVIGTEREEARVALIPLGRYGQPEDIADAALFLASDLSRFVNGTSLVVDGGQLHV